MPVLFSVNSDFPLSSSSLLDSSGSSGTQGSLDFFHMGKFGFFPLTNSIPFQLFKQNNKTKLCRRSDCTTPGVFLISMGFFFVCLFNNQPESFQSPSRRAFPFPPSFFPLELQISHCHSLHSNLREASQVSHSFHELCPSLPLMFVIYGICHHPLPKCLLRIQKMRKVWISAFPKRENHNSQVFFPRQPFFLRKFPI